MDTPTSWVQLIDEAFPDRVHLPEDCAIPLGIEVNQWDFGEAIDAATRLGEREAFIRRLHLAHPPQRLDHDRQFDDRFWNAFIEAEALAWADLQGMRTPRFVEREGAPDIAVEDGWVEAKTIEESIEEREEVDRLYRAGATLSGEAHVC